MTNLTETLQIRGERSRLTALSHNFTQWGIKKLPGMGQTSDSDHPNLPSGGPSSLFLVALDCELSLFFFKFYKGGTRARERWGAKLRDASNEGGSPRRSRAPPVAFSHARGHLRVSGVLLDGPRKKRDCSLSMIAWSQVTTTPSNNLYWGHLALIPS